MANNFNLKLDTLGPTGSISTGGVVFTKNNFNLVLSYSDGAAGIGTGVTHYKAWFNSKAKGTTSDTEFPSEWSVINGTSLMTTFSTDGIYYYHIVYRDAVGNASAVYDCGPITYDKTNPTLSLVQIRELDGSATELVNHRDVIVHFEFSDNLSKVASCAVTGDVDTTHTAWDSTITASEQTTGKADRAIWLAGTDPEHSTKTVSITVSDNAGNTSTAKSDTIVLDTEGLAGSIIVRNRADSQTLNNTWINYQEIKIKLDLADETAGDVVAYKVWGDINDSGSATGISTEPSTWTSVTKGTDPIIAKINNKEIYLTSGDASAKTIRAKVKDEAGNETTLDAVIVKYDHTAPSVSVSANKTHVSLISGYNTVVFTPTVNADISGAASYQWYLNGSEIAGASGSGSPSALTVNSSTLGAEGAKVFTLKVTDNAGNSTTSSGVTVYLDTTAPTGTISVDAWYNGNESDTDHSTYTAWDLSTFTTSIVDGPAAPGAAAGLSEMTVWVSAVAHETVPAGLTSRQYVPVIPHNYVQGTAVEGINYLHAEYVDNVGNRAIVDSPAFKVDTVRPIGKTVAFDQAAYKTRSANLVNITYTDVTSPVEGFKMKVYGDIATSEAGTTQITEATAQWEQYTASKQVYLYGADGNKTVYIKFKDVAGNYSVNAISAMCELDTVGPSASAATYETDNTTPKTGMSAVQTFIVRISGHEDQKTPADPTNLEYLIYGDFNTNKSDADAGQGITSESAVWTPVGSWETGKDYKILGTYYAVKPQGTDVEKQINVYVKLRDNAGNITDAFLTPAFIYDIGVPTVDVSNIDHNTISKVHSARLDGSSELTCYNDEMHFKFKPSEKIQAWKVCAYLDVTAAQAGSHEDDPIPMVGHDGHKSINMSNSGQSSDATIDCTIVGCDFESALNDGQGEVSTHEFDGLHIVVVYVQDLGGNWSTAAQFSA